MLDQISTDYGAPVGIAIVEGDPALGENLRHAVDSMPDARCIGVWRSANSGLRKIDAFRPTIVLLDIDLPDMCGIKATALLKRFLPGIHVIILANGDDHERVLEAMRAGARGFLLKPERLRRSRPTDALQDALILSDLARRATEALHQSPAAPERIRQTVSLTAREREVARLIAQGLTNKEIGDRMNIATHTVHGYIKIIFKKLKVRSRTEVAVTLLQSGV